MRIAQEEIFGPDDSAHQGSRLRRGGSRVEWDQVQLSSSIFTRDVNKAVRAMRDLVAGIRTSTPAPPGAEVHLPFCGTKEMSTAPRGRSAALDVFTEWKSIYVDSSAAQRAQIEPHE